MTSVPTYADVVSAANRISPFLHRTPVVTSATIDARAGAAVYAKGEHVQKVGAFKARGAMNAVLLLSDEQRAAGVYTHSSGNHGQAVAYAAAVCGSRATIVMPEDASLVKVAAVRSYGAEIVFCAQKDRDTVLANVVAEQGGVIVHPFDDPAVVAGQGTAALELVEDVPDLDIILAPIGGGGLLSGSTLVAHRHGISTVGAEPALVDDAFRSLRDSARYGSTGAKSVADGLLTGIGAIPFAILSSHGVEILVVSEDEIMEALHFVMTRTKQVIEPSSAAAYAALFANRERFDGLKVGLVISGGNVDLSTISP